MVGGGEGMIGANFSALQARERTRFPLTSPPVVCVALGRDGLCQDREDSFASWSIDRPRSGKSCDQRRRADPTIYAHLVRPCLSISLPWDYLSFPRAARRTTRRAPRTAVPAGSSASLS